MTSNKSKEYWNSRSNLGPEAGTKDLISKELEYQAISKYISDGMLILDAGCGNGLTTIRLAEQYKIDIVGVDFSEKMIEQAVTHLSSLSELKGKVEFKVSDITNLPFNSETFDLVYTERAIINLPDWATQRKVIEYLGAVAKQYIMIESSQNGLDRINEVRLQIDLPKINPPWHNRYLRDEEISSVGLNLIEVVDFSSTYYFLSRIVNAHLARLGSKEPDYNSPVNQLALKLPSFISGFGQTKLWVWEKGK